MTAAVAALALLFAAADPQAYTVVPAQSAIRFHVHHKLHSSDGQSSSIEGKAVVQPDGKVLAMIRVPIASFDSGDANRDANMRDTLEVGRFPFVVFKGVTSLVMPAAQAKGIPTTIQGELEFHGVKQHVEVPATLQFAGDGSARVTGKMTLSLDSYRIERPSLLMIKLDDACAIEFDLKLKRG
jgi:polyisoprenoid-binding protein YceI